MSSTATSSTTSTPTTTFLLTAWNECCYTAFDPKPLWYRLSVLISHYTLRKYRTSLYFSSLSQGQYLLQCSFCTLDPFVPLWFALYRDQCCTCISSFAQIMLVVLTADWILKMCSYRRSVIILSLPEELQRALTVNPNHNVDFTDKATQSYLSLKSLIR